MCLLRQRTMTITLEHIDIRYGPAIIAIDEPSIQTTTSSMQFHLNNFSGERNQSQQLANYLVRLQNVIWISTRIILNFQGIGTMTIHALPALTTERKSINLKFEIHCVGVTSARVHSGKDSVLKTCYIYGAHCMPLGNVDTKAPNT